jgi:anti-anti-sigma factor
MRIVRGERPAGAVSAKIVLEGGVLRINGNPAHADFAAFEKACSTVLSTLCACIVMDLTRCTYLSSMFVGLLVDTVTQLKGAGRKVRLCVSPEVGQFFNMAHLYHLFDYEILAPSGGQD